MTTKQQGMVVGSSLSNISGNTLNKLITNCIPDPFLIDSAFSLNFRIINPLTLSLSDITWRLSDITWRLSDITWRLRDITWRLSDITWRLSDITYRLSDITYRLSDILSVEKAFSLKPLNTSNQ